MTAVVSEIRSGIVILQVDDPPVNETSQDIGGRIVVSIARAIADAAVQAIILIGHGLTFIAGAEIRRFGKPPASPTLRDVCKSIDDCPKPVVAALHGTVFGGGLDLVLACMWRKLPAS